MSYQDTINPADMKIYQKKAAIKYALKVEKTGKGFYKKGYFTLEDINSSLQPLLEKYHCLVETNFVSGRCVGNFICTDSGDVMETELPMPSYIQEEIVNKDVPATAGSYITYFRRYILLVMFDISERDLIEEEGVEDEPEEAHKKEISKKASKIKREETVKGQRFTAPDFMEDVVKYGRRHHNINTTKGVLNISSKEMLEKGLIAEKEFKKVSAYIADLNSKDVVVLP